MVGFLEEALDKLSNVESPSASILSVSRPSSRPDGVGIDTTPLARLTVHGRRLLVARVRDDGWPIAHAAKAMGVSRQYAHRWVARYDAEGDAGLQDRSSRPHSSPNRTPVEIERVVCDARESIVGVLTGWDPNWECQRGR